MDQTDTLITILAYGVGGGFAIGTILNIIGYAIFGALKFVSDYK